MKINLSPMRTDEPLELHREDAVIYINGEAFDFTKLEDGDTLPATAVKSRWFVDQVENIEGEIELTLILPLPVNYSPEQAFPAPLVNVINGPVLLPKPLPAPEEVSPS